MSQGRTPRNSMTPERVALDLTTIHSDVVFLPSPNHRRVKSKFWQRYEDLGGEVSLELAQSITAEPGIRKWWPLPGFREWFLNQDEARERLEYLYMVALDAAEELLLNPDSNHNAKVQMIKVIAQLAGKEPNKYDKFVDETIQKMDSAKLKAFIEKESPKFLKAEPKAEPVPVDSTDIPKEIT